MSVKSHAVLFRNLLYVREVVNAGSIRLAAEQNNIKASNLSKIITDTEDLLHQKLFFRTAYGMVPLKSAVELSGQTEKMVQNLLNLKQKFLADENGTHLRVYVSKGLEIDSLSDFSGKIEYVDGTEYADVIVSAEKPKEASKMVCVEHKIGSVVRQKIWVCAQNNQHAMDLATFILSRFVG